MPMKGGPKREATGRRATERRALNMEETDSGKARMPESKRGGRKKPEADMKREAKRREGSRRDVPKKGAIRRDGAGHQAPGSGTGKGAASKLCPVASKCGGCQWINKGYGEQLEAKSTKFRKLMEPYCRPEHIIPMDAPDHYRNKVHAVFGEDARHNAISGTYEEKSHRIVPIDSCLIENRKADEIIVSIRGLLRSFKIRPYDEDTGRGLLRHVLVRVGHATGHR